MLRPYLSMFENEVAAVDPAPDLKFGIGSLLRANPRQAYLFPDLGGNPAVGNLWGTRERIATALGTDREGLGARLSEAIASPLDVELAPNNPFRPLRSGLTTLPVPTYYRGDSGPYLTPCIVIAEYDGIRNLSFHRMRILDDTHVVARIVPRHLFALHRRAQKRGEQVKVAVVMTFSPDVLFGGALSVGLGEDELRVASRLRQRSVGEPVRTVTLDNGIAVPDCAEFVWTGTLTDQTHEEGPFVDITGTYDLVRTEPVIHLPKAYARPSPTWYTMLSGGYEHYYLMGLPREPVIAAAVGRSVPEVHGVRLTEGGCCWLHGIVSITKQSEGDAKNAIMAAFGAHTSMKHVVIVDSDVDIYDDRAVEWAIATRVQADRDLLVITGARGSSLDPSSHGTTSKLGIDATMPLKGREPYLRGQ